MPVLLGLCHVAKVFDMKGAGLPVAIAAMNRVAEDNKQLRSYVENDI
jgi:hypothetical protein